MKKKKDLIFLTSAYPFGNGETFIENEIGYLSEAFNKIYIISKNFNDVQTREVPKNCEVHRIKKDYLKVFNLLDKYYLIDFIKNFEFSKIKDLFLFQMGSKLMELKIREVIRNNKLDKDNLEVYSYWFNHEAYASSILKRKGIINNFISRAHGYDLYKYRKIQVLKEEILKEANCILSVSKKGMNYLKNEYKRDNIGTEYLGTINKNKFKVKEKNKLLVSCSSLIPLKRIELIIKGLSKLDDKYKDLQWIHLGDGEERVVLEELAKKELKNIKYEFKGNISNKNVLEFYKNNDVLCFLHMSSSEGLPVSMMEVQSFGIPIIATDVGGVGEIVNDRTGILLKEDVRVDEIALNIEKFINMHEEEYKSYQVNSYENWKENFSAEKNYREFIKKYL